MGVGGCRPPFPVNDPLVSDHWGIFFVFEAKKTGHHCDDRCSNDLMKRFLVPANSFESGTRLIFYLILIGRFMEVGRNCYAPEPIKPITLRKNPGTPKKSGVMR